MADVVLFSEAKVGDQAYTYESPTLDEFGWVTDLEYFDDRWDEMTVTRKRWQLVEVDEIILPNPHPIEGDDA